MEQKLNHFLADLAVEYHKLQNFHWYVKGKDFFTVHSKLEEYYDGIVDMVDETAEAILMLGGKPLASMKSFLGETSVKEASESFISSEELLKEVKKDFEMLQKEAEEIKGMADDQKCYAVSTLMDDSISHFSKAVWMLGQQSV